MIYLLLVKTTWPADSPTTSNTFISSNSRRRSGLLYQKMLTKEFMELNITTEGLICHLCDILLKALAFHFQLVPRTICWCPSIETGFYPKSPPFCSLSPLFPLTSSAVQMISWKYKTSITFTRSRTDRRPPRTPARLPHYCLRWFGLAAVLLLHHQHLKRSYYSQGHRDQPSVYVPLPLLRWEFSNFQIT